MQDLNAQVVQIINRKDALNNEQDLEKLEMEVPFPYEAIGGPHCRPKSVKYSQ